jgi:hypothetical protein
MGLVSASTQPLSELSPDELAVFLAAQQAAHAELAESGLKLDLTQAGVSAA